MKSDTMLMIPGPTPVPQAVLEVLARPPIGHRSAAFKEILKNVHAGLQWLFQTQRPVFLYTASGTGAMEAAMANVFNPGDNILCLSCGVFSHRWVEIGQSLGINVTEHTVPPGQPNDVADLETALNNAPLDLKAVCLIHNETSTGVINPLQDLVRIIRNRMPDALIIVDTVTGLGATEFKFDDWDIDIAVSGSQKGLMLPPGLAFLAASERAMAAHQHVKNPGYYFNFSKYEKSATSGDSPYTPALGLIRGLEKALELLQAEGLENVIARHSLNRKMIRQAAQAMRLPLLVTDESLASPSVTSIQPPEGMSVNDIRTRLREQFSITIADGQKELVGKIFRVGHLGAIFPRDVLMSLSALETVLHQLGYQDAPLGAGMAAAQHTYNLAQTPQAQVAAHV